MHPELKKLYTYMLGEYSEYYARDIRTWDVNTTAGYYWYTIDFLSKLVHFDDHHRIILRPNDGP